MEPSTEDDGLKWFGEGFDGFPKRLPDDCVEYIIYLVDSELASSAAQRNRLNEILRASESLKKKLLKDYIWQRDAFELKLQPQLVSRNSETAKLSDHDKFNTVPRLYGRTNFGDSVADEWLIVYMLVELSKQFTDAWIRIYDTDGEFLLIEAANALPKWLNPEIAENRVWINNGHLRIIPPSDESTPKKLSLSNALKSIETDPTKLIISPFIEDEAFYRLREYPSAISSSLHHALITIPRRLAYILHCNPAFTSPAIEAFYLRDPISLRPLSSKDLSPLVFAPEDFVTVSAKFTKVGYAQLRSQIFDAPSSWAGVIPRLEDVKVQMGMKLTCGFEMLISDSQNQDKRVVREIKLLLEDIETGDETLPTDADLPSWPQTQDDEKWLDIDYNDFENELAGKSRGAKDATGEGFGDKGAQENLRKMVSRFEAFLNDDTAGAEGAGDDLDIDDDEESVSDTDEEEDNEKFDEEEFKTAMNDTKDMSSDYIEKSGLLDEARRLALEDAEEQSDVDEDEEMKKVMELMEQELKGHGALKLNGKTSKANSDKVTKPVFGPERPPGMLTTKAGGKSRAIQELPDDDEVGPGDGELSSDDEEFNDVDLGLAKNMLESFKGQAGMAGPAGNLMRAMGINMPRDEGRDDEGAHAVEEIS